MIALRSVFSLRLKCLKISLHLEYNINFHHFLSFLKLKKSEFSATITVSERLNSTFQNQLLDLEFNFLLQLHLRNEIE